MLPLEQLKQQNMELMQTAVKHRKPDKFADTVVTELLKERGMGQVDGPFSTPHDWATQMVGVTTRLDNVPSQEEACRPMPCQPVHTTVAFNIVTETEAGQPKVRRGEDWKRSLGNAAAKITNSPTNQTVDDMTARARATFRRGWHKMKLWGTTTMARIARSGWQRW